MKYDTLYDEFTQCFPEDLPRFQEIAECAAAERSDGMHVMFGMVVIPFVIEQLEKCNEPKLKRAFDFFERMAEDDNTMISEVLEFTVLEDLISRGDSTLEKCKTYMGQKTRERCSIVEKYMM